MIVHYGFVYLKRIVENVVHLLAMCCNEQKQKAVFLFDRFLSYDF